MFGMKKYFFLLIAIIFLTAALIAGCDIYENENGDWANEVTLKISNTSNCLFDLKIDGTSYGSMNPGDEIEENEFGRGIHLIEAYPWNDEQFSCDFVYTPNLSSGEIFEWNVTNDGGCQSCEPTPTPAPETPTPSPTP